ncbi:hypothetical protein LOY38_12510 [Pseudomonas sp. B21-015]|uniref:hypothetical protein n=1 Tax=Pseudomonas sp. B21-015 TaxID=2895473 RepID=UPI0021603E1B|nr:hypothetical protein [Pseudomonas sp. B21-015]UVM52783.1 hypothetical protein LOY38_12510 [Pseudomonas sp. B21-015]
MERGKGYMRWFVGLFLSLFFTHGVWAVTGPEVAQLLNARYRLSVSECVGATAIHYCSGVLARRSQNAPTVGFWKLSAEAVSSGVERFDYWRVDRAPVLANRPNGFVFTDVFTAIGLGKQLDVLPAASNSEASVKNWDDGAPARAPLQALFYDLGTAGALRGAQRDQLAYFRATGEWLPILRMQRDDAQQSLFGFNQADQLYVGYQVAARLNARYADTSPTCRDGRAAFYCNGVLIRTTDQSTAFHSWNPSPGSVRGNGASFSYLRADAGVIRLYKVQGFVIREQAAPVGNPMSLRCAYPFDGGTSGSADACRVRGGMCGELGVTSVQAWTARYAARPNSSCAFNLDPQQFQLSIDVRLNRSDYYGWNEFMVAAWPQDNPSQLPIEAFIYTTQALGGGNGLAGAQYDQKDYFQVSGRYIPIMRVTLNAAPGQVFVFDPQEQGVQ